MENSASQSEALSSLANVRMFGRFAVVKTLGRGGMGEVFKALDAENNRFVAIKVLEASAASDEELLKRFEREARSAMAIDHPNVAKIYGLEYDAKRQPFIIMEFIDGEPLDKFVRSGTDVHFSTLVDFVIQTARGLESAHRRAIIHRDVKPSNLLITAGLQVRIIDFGLAKSMWDTSIVTGTGMVVGTPRYISPEQALGRTVDHRSDIYSLGATFYEIVTHQVPFDGDTAMAIMLKHISTPLIPPYMINSKVPGDVNEIICRMMAKDPSDRYQEYEPLIRDLESAKIHRLSKERRIQSVRDEELMASTPGIRYDARETVPSAPAPVPYLEEGLVDAEFTTQLPRHEGSSGRVLIYSLLGVLIIATLVFVLVESNPPQNNEKPSWLASKVGKWLRGEEPSSGPTPEELAAMDEQRINLTLERMRSAVTKIAEYRKTPGYRAAIPRIVEMRSKGAISVLESRDGWGNDFVVSSANNGTISVAGRDGVEGTEDDFVMTLDGTVIKSPRALPAEHFAPKKK